MEWEDHVDRLHIAIRANFLEEEVLFGGIADKLDCPKCLTDRERRDGEVILASSSDGIGGYLVVKFRSGACGIRVVAEEERDLYRLVRCQSAS